MADPDQDPAAVTPARRGGGLLRRFGPLILLACALIAVLALGGGDRLSLHALAARRALLQARVHAHPVAAVAAYVAVYTLAVALSLPVALALTLTGGLLFGGLVGGAAAAVSCTLGSVVVFLVCRTAVGDLLRRRAGPTIARFAEGVRRDAFFFVVALRLVPVTPFWLANIALGFIDMPLVVMATASFIGIAPVSFVYAGLGASLNLLLARGVRPDAHLALRPEVWAPLAGLALLALAPAVLRRFRRGSNVES